MPRSRGVDDLSRSETPAAGRIERASTDVAVTRGHQAETPGDVKERPPTDDQELTGDSRAGRQRIRTYSHDEDDHDTLTPEQVRSFIAMIREEVGLDWRRLGSVVEFLTPSSGEPLLTHWHVG